MSSTSSVSSYDSSVITVDVGDSTDDSPVGVVNPKTIALVNNSPEVIELSSFSAVESAVVGVEPIPA